MAMMILLCKITNMNTIQAQLANQQYVDPDMVITALNFWYTNHDEIRSPIPDYMKEPLSDRAIRKFLEWTQKLNDQAKKEINDEILLERFEEILFAEAKELAQSEDEKITIQYPFLMRVGDRVSKDDMESIIVKREIEKDGDSQLLVVTFKNTLTNNEWTTSFELP